MKKLKLILTLIIIGSEQLLSQGTGSITGKVVDQITNESLPGVNIVISGTTRGASTDINGEFSISGL